MEQKSTITIDVVLDEQKMPGEILWNASQSTADAQQKARAMLLSLWDGEDKSALRIDLWTKEMMVDEMADFFYQTFIGMADSFKRATGNEGLTTDMKNFARDFYKKFRAQQADQK
jgi:gliding motility-associated protein GldC